MEVAAGHKDVACRPAEEAVGHRRRYLEDTSQRTVLADTLHFEAQHWGSRSEEEEAAAVAAEAAEQTGVAGSHSPSRKDNAKQC